MSELGNRRWGFVAGVGTLLVGNLIAAGEAASFADTTVTTGPSRTVADTTNPSVRQELLRLKTADPVADVAEAIKKGDTRFLEVAGYSVEVPGVPKGPKLGWLKLRYGVRRIEGTTDNKMVPELQQAAQWYAERYNKLLLENIERR